MADDDPDNLFRSNKTWTESHIGTSNSETLEFTDDVDAVHDPVQVQEEESSVSCDGEVRHFSSVRTTGDVQQETQEHYVTENVGSHIISIRTGFTQLFQNLSTDINELKEVVYKHFLSSIKSSSGDSSGLGAQIPIFVVEIMAQKSASDLFNLLKSKTPYCDIFNFLDFIESITNKIGDEKAKKIVSCSKEAIFCMKKDEIIPYMDKEHPEKEGFSKVVLQMHENFDICAFGEIHQLKKQTSFILRLQNLVCFVACDEERQTVTYLIPSILTERACTSARQVADRFVYNGILHITIGGQKIVNIQHEPILQKQQSLHLDISSMKIKVDVCLKVSYSIEVKLSYTIAVVKQIIHKTIYIPPSMQTLRYHEESLENDGTVKSYKIKEHDTIVLMPEVTEIYDDMIKLLPSNCQYAVTQWKQSFSEVEGIFHTLSQTYDDHVPLYENLLPFVFEKCGYNVLQFIDVTMKAIRDEKKRKKFHELRNGISQLKYISDEAEIDSVNLQPLTLVESAQNIQSAVQKPNESARVSTDTQPLGVITDVKPKCEPSHSGGHHVPHVSHLVETAEIKDDAKSSPRPPEKEDDKAELEMQPNKISTENQPNTAKPHSPENEVSKLPTSLPDDTSLPDNLVSSEDFIEIKIHYDNILRLMPKDYGLTLDGLQEDITADEMAPILGIDNPDVANRKILNCLIQKLKNREQMLDFCHQLEKVITSQDLKAITDEIKSGVQQGIQFSSNPDSTHTQSVTASTHQAPNPSHLLKYPLCLQPPKLPTNFVHRPEHLNVIVSKLCNTTSNLNAHSKVIAVTGVGGFGKTTIVTRLCYDPRVQRQFTGGVFFIELGSQATDPIVKLNEIYCSMVGEGIENINVETEIANIFKENFLVVIDDVWDVKDAAPLVKAFRNGHVVFTARRNDIAQNLTTDENIVRIGPMKIDEAVTLLSDGLFDLDKISSDNKELLKDLAQDAHMWPILLCLVRGQLNHHLKLNINVHKAIETVQRRLRDRGLTAFDKSNVESAKIYKSISIYIESTLELLPEAALNRFITLILFTGIGGIFSEAALPSLWDSSDLEAKKVVKTLSDYGLLSFKNIFMSQYLKDQVVVHTHSVISQYMFDNVRSDQVASLSPFGLLRTNNSVSDKLESLFKISYLQQDVSQLTPREYLTYTMLKMEHVAIPFQLKRITAHILHDPHYILLMLQRIHNTICASVNHIKIITQVSEKIVALDSMCKKALKDAQVLNRIINSEVQHFLFKRDYDKLEKTLEEHCMAFSNGKIAQDCIELINQIIPMCETSILESFNFVRQMLETLTPPHHFITMEKLPIMKLYIGLHRDIVSSLSTGSTELYKMYTYTTSGDFNKKLDLVSSNYSTKLTEIAPIVLSSSLAMFKK